MRGMVSQVKGGKRPPWIGDTLWKLMCEFWETEPAQSKSSSASSSRLSERGGLGIAKHVAGQKSYLRIHQEMEEELGRPVSIGEVFVKTHTRADGTFVDRKAQKITETFQRSIEDRQSQILGSSGDSSEHNELTTDEMNTIFIESSIPNRQGTPYGLGSLETIFGKGKKHASEGTYSALASIQEQLIAAQRMIEEQVALNETQKAMFEAKQAKYEEDAANHHAQMSYVCSWIQRQDPLFEPSMAGSTSRPPP